MKPLDIAQEMQGCYFNDPDGRVPVYLHVELAKQVDILRRQVAMLEVMFNQFQRDLLQCLQNIERKKHETNELGFISGDELLRG